MIGRTFGRLTVVSEEQRDRGGKRQWRCACVCGGSHVVRDNNLKAGNVRSCGCLVRSTHIPGETPRRPNAGKSSTRLYRIWCHMRERCRNPNSTGWQWYGGRGISVCDEWMEFAPFEEWAIANGYRADLSIDRIDSDGNYSPHNCRWADAETQARNTRRVALDEAAVREIRSSPAPRRDLARKFGVTPRQVSRVRARTTWASVK